MPPQNRTFWGLPWANMDSGWHTASKSNADSAGAPVDPSKTLASTYCGVLVPSECDIFKVLSPLVITPHEVQIAVRKNRADETRMSRRITTVCTHSMECNSGSADEDQAWSIRVAFGVDGSNRTQRADKFRDLRSGRVHELIEY